MAEPARRVFIVEHDRDSLEMLRVLVGEGQRCEIRGALASEGWRANFREIKAFSPGLIILDFIPRPTETWRLLDQLRADDSTASIPVLSLSTAEPVVEQTLVSFNVRKIVVKPFDVDILNAAVGDLLSQPRVEVPAVPLHTGAEALREAADILVEEARTVVGNWLQAVGQTEPFKSQAPLRPPQVLDEMPLVLWGTAAALRLGGAEQLFRPQSSFHRAAVVHAVERRGQGVSLGPLVHEYKLLRDSIWQTLRSRAPRERWTVEDVFRVGEVVHKTLDEVVAIAVEAYREATERKAGESSQSP